MTRGLRITSLLLLIFTLSSTALSNPSPKGTQPPTPTVPPATEVRLSEEDNGRQIELKEDQLLVITLEGNPSTGYMWEVEEADEKVLRQVGEIELQSLSPLLGAPAKETLRFQPLEEGQTTLELVYHCPWEKGVAPAETFSIQLQAVGPFTGLDISPPPSDTPATTPPKSAPGSPLPVADQPQLSLPSSFNWCPGGGGYCTPVKNQGNCGSCWAFSTVGALESKILMQDALTKDLSEQYLVSCNTDGWDCCGGWWAHDYHQWKIPPSGSQAGAVMEAAFPYGSAAIYCGDPEVPCSGPYPHSYQIDSWAFVGPEYGVPSVADIKQAIYDHGPVSVAVCAGPAWSSYVGGVFTTDESSTCGIYEVNHAVVLVGWNDADGAWILRNSWGGTWGEGGYMRIGYGASNVGYSANYIFYNELPNKLYLPLVMKNYPPSGLAEGFEGGAVPPSGWTLLQTNVNETWKIMTVGTPHSGSYAADCEYDPALDPQDELLLSPAMNITSGSLEFWSFGSLYWCRDDHDNCDLNVWLVVGAWGGGDDIYLGKADDDWTATWAWSQSTFNLTPYLPGGPVKIGFQYTGLDGAQIALDDISVH